MVLLFEFGLWIGIRDWEYEIRDYRIRNWNWGLGIEIWDWGLGLMIEIGDWDGNRDWGLGTWD